MDKEKIDECAESGKAEETVIVFQIVGVAIILGLAWEGLKFLLEGYGI